MQELEEEIVAEREPWMDKTLTPAVESLAIYAKHDFGRYVKLALGFQDIQYSWHPLHSIIVSAVMQAERNGMKCVIAAPPGCGKTSIVRNYAPFRLGNDPKLSIGFVSYSEGTASENLTHCRKMLTSSLARYMWPAIVPDLEARKGDKGEWSKVKLYLRGQMEPCAEAKTVLSDVAGRRRNILIFDDAVTQVCQESLPVLEKVHDRIHGTWLYRLTSDGFALFLNNCWHRADTIHEFRLRAEDYNALVLWVGYNWECDEMVYNVFNAPKSWAETQMDEEGTFALWDKQSQKNLIEKRANPRTFKRLYMQQATVEEDSFLPSPKHWKTYKPDELPGPITGAKAVAYLDVSGGKYVEKNDYAAMTWGIKGPDGTLYIMDAWAKKCSPREQVGALWTAHKAAHKLGYNGLRKAQIECLSKDEKWIEEPLREWLEERKQAEVHVPRMPWEFDYADKLAAKESRISALYEPLFSGDIKFPEGFYEQARGLAKVWDARRREMWAIFVDQCEDFGNKVAIHDDCPDSLAGLKRLADRVYAGPLRMNMDDTSRYSEHVESMAKIRRDDMKAGNSVAPRQRGIDGLPLVKQATVGRAWNL